MKRLREFAPSADKARHFVKAISYRIYSTCITMLIAAFVTGDSALAFAIGGVDFSLKIFTYYFHERVWYYIPFGRQVAVKAIDAQRSQPHSVPVRVPARKSARKYYRSSMRSAIPDRKRTRRLRSKRSTEVETQMHLYGI